MTGSDKAPSNPLSEVRQRIANRLNDADLHAYAIVPEKTTPPLTLVAPGDPYRTREGATFGGEIVRCSVVAIVGRGVNTRRADELDALALAVVDALEADPDLVVGETGQPGQIDINGQTCLGVSVEVLIEIHRSQP